jgi:hypothetical protein
MGLLIVLSGLAPGTKPLVAVDGFPLFLFPLR